MNRIFNEEVTANIELKLCFNQVRANPYEIYCVIFSEGKETMEVIDGECNLWSFVC